MDLFARVNGFVQFTRCCASHFHGAFFADTTVRIQPNYNYVVNYRPEVTRAVEGTIKSKTELTNCGKLTNL